jgi:protein-S-isoprenylcysteine O-methyltransferase Ste14
MIFLTVAIGGGSLILFGYFLSAGTPFPIGIAGSDTARLAFDSLLCLVFFVQHSGMIRRCAKKRIARRVPAIYLPALYSIVSGLALLVLVLLWQPTNHILYSFHGPIRWLTTLVAVVALAGFAWGILALRGFDPFGTLPLRAALRGTAMPSSALLVRGPYRYVRHPLYLFVLILIWATPRLSTDQLLFNLLWTFWIVVGTKLEERDLLIDFGQTYRQYQDSVPMLIPLPRLFRHRRQGTNTA